jgi:hypothetical protein
LILQHQADEAKFDAVVQKLDRAASMEVEHIIISSPAKGKYEVLKFVLINRFSDSPDRRLHKALHELELGDRKVTQLVREMRSLAGGRTSDDVLRVHVLGLLPLSIQRVLKIVKNASLDEIQLTDEIMENDKPSPTSYAVSSASRFQSPPLQGSGRTEEVCRHRQRLNSCGKRWSDSLRSSTPSPSTSPVSKEGDPDNALAAGHPQGDGLRLLVSVACAISIVFLGRMEGNARSLVQRSGPWHNNLDN